MYQSIKNILDGKDIMILGFGREGRSTLDFIRDFVLPKSVTVADRNDVTLDLPKGVFSACGESYMDHLDNYDVIIKSPGIVFADQPMHILEKTTSQTDLFLKEFREKTIGITGTKGKSTTTTLIHCILKNACIDAVLTGNIGIPPLDSARQMKEDSVAVFEMSCHQLEFQKVSPHIAVLLNLFEDHLDHYSTRENYIKAKEHIFLCQTSDDVLVISDECTEQIKKAPSRVITVGTQGDYSYVLGSVNGIDIPLDEISLIGEHNLFNITAAKAVTDLMGVAADDFIKGLKAYKSLPHRLEYIATKNGVDYYDDSISTVCRTTIQAVSSLENVQTVIIGGMDRGIDYTELVEFSEVHPVKNIILVYESGKRIARMLGEKQIACFLTDDLVSAVSLAAKVSKPGEKCVLSPAAASYGYFKNFEERGNVFRMLVNKL